MRLSRLIEFFIRVSSWCGVILVVLPPAAAASSVLIGGRLPRVLALDWASAVGFSLAGLALVTSRRAVDGSRVRWVARLLSLLVGLIGLERLMAVGWVFPWLDAQIRSSLATTAGGDKSFNPGYQFLIAAAALWLINGRGRWRQGPAQLFALASALISFEALLSIGYELVRESGRLTLQRMGLPSALSFAILSVGLLLARPGRGLMAILTSPGPGGVMARRLLPACMFVPIGVGWLLLAGEFNGPDGQTAGVAFLVVSNVVVVIGLIWANAGLIDRMEDERRATHQALLESEAFYHSLVESLPQNIIRKDGEGRFTFANRRFCESVGLPLESIVGRDDHDFYPLALADKYRNDDRRVLEAGEPFEVVEEHITPTGDVRYVQVLKTPLKDAEGRPIGVQGIFWDITERWRYEERLRDQNEQLQALAESERRALEELKSAQSRMVQTAKLAGLGEMVAGVAHEINNPLSFVSNNVSVLRRDLDEVRHLIRLYEDAEGDGRPDCHPFEKVRAFRDEVDMEYTLSNLDGLLDRTREGLRRIQRIVGDLRVFARLDEGELDMVDLNGGIASTVGIVQGNAKKKHVRIDLDLAPLPLVHCCLAKINQVIMNLVSNAIDACDEGGSIRVRTAPEPGGVVVEVEDTGCGIQPEVRERIFDPFFTTKPVGVGTGLGLSISYSIVQDHGGTIEVESTPGAGTRFLVHLPLLMPSARRVAGSPPRGSDRLDPLDDRLTKPSEIPS